MKLVIKIGGAALDDKEVVSTFAKTIPSLWREGHKLVIVHGGGAALSRTLKQLGCETTFVNGLRVTDSQTRDVAMMVLAGQLNKQLVAAIGEAGQPAIGICGGDLRMVLASKKKQPDLGYVGEVMLRRFHLDRALLGCGRGAGGLQPGAGLRWRVLQRECRPDGVGVCGGLRARMRWSI